jgi:hypothetical protein
MENQTAIKTHNSFPNDIQTEDIKMLIDFVREFKKEEKSIRKFIDDLNKRNLDFNKTFDDSMKEIHSNLNSKGQ